MPIRRHYGALPDTYDPNDAKYAYARVVAPSKRPDHVDLEVKGEPIWDQGQLGSCWENACAAEINDVQGDFTLSRLWLYYKARVRMRTTHEDSGTASRPALHVLLHQGAAPESDWTYDIDKFAQAPPHKANVDAKQEVIDAYRRLPDLDFMLDCLAAKRTFMLGIYVYDGFESDEAANTGVIPMPKLTDAPIGGHEIQAKGYHWTGDPDTSLVKFRNSWHDDWGDRGYGYLPFSYLTGDAMDSYVLDHCHARAAAA
jgi:C1A family cysteine protease